MTIYYNLSKDITLKLENGKTLSIISYDADCTTIDIDDFIQLLNTMRDMAKLYKEIK